MGADLIFVVTPNKIEDLQRIAREVHAPQMAVVGEDGTSVLTVRDLAEIGFSVVSFP